MLTISGECLAERIRIEKEGESTKYWVKFLDMGGSITVYDCRDLYDQLQDGQVHVKLKAGINYTKTGVSIGQIKSMEIMPPGK